MTRSRAKAHLEDTFESKEEEIEPLAKKGMNPNKFHCELETAREKAAQKQYSLDHLVRIYPIEKWVGEMTEGKKDKVPPQTHKK